MYRHDTVTVLLIAADADPASVDKNGYACAWAQHHALRDHTMRMLACPLLLCPIVT